jgi:hypothetical protein
MTYTSEQLEEIEKDPERLRAMFWRVAMSNRQRAGQQREEARRAPFDDGPRLLREAEISERFAATILENLDAFVEAARAPAP